MIAQLQAHPGWAALMEWRKAQRELYFDQLGRHLFDKTRPHITEVDLAYKRGFFSGMERLLVEPLIEAKAIEREERKRQQEGEQ